jgi:septal ring factor EnvC (AmiA/AmiB activator)
MNQQEIIERLIKIEEQEKTNASIIQELKEEVKQNRELTIAVKEIATETKHLREDQQDMNKRLKAIEEKPIQKWDKVTMTIIGTVVGTIAGAGISLILK